MTITYENPIGFLKNEAEIVNIELQEKFLHIVLKGKNQPANINIQMDINEVARLVSSLSNIQEPEK